MFKTTVASFSDRPFDLLKESGHGSERNSVEIGTGFRLSLPLQ